MERWSLKRYVRGRTTFTYVSSTRHAGTEEMRIAVNPAKNGRMMDACDFAGAADALRAVVAADRSIGNALGDTERTAP